MRTLRRIRTWLVVVWAAARLRPLIVSVAINDGHIHAVTDDEHPEIVLGRLTAINNCRIRARIYVAGDHVTVTSNVIDLGEQP